MTNMVTNEAHGVRQFIEKYVEVDPLGIIPKQELYDKYVVYCQANGYIPHTKGIFSKALKQLIDASSQYSICSPPPAVSGVFDIATTRRTIDGSRMWCWAGITFKPEKEGEEAEEENPNV